MFLLIDKPKGITSHDVIYQLRKITSIRKIGHAGTLDPNATGLLIVGIGRESTKKLGYLTTDTTKEYVADIILGEERDTHDSEGVVTQRSHLRQGFGGKVKLKTQNHISKFKVEETLKKFEGEIKQVPPVYSAIKIKGKKAYELARKGKEMKLLPRKVTIHSIKLLKYKYPLLKIRTKVSSGTYIRALARDMGRDLGTYGYLGDLRRTKIGSYGIESAIELEKLTTDNWEKYTINI